MDHLEELAKVGGVNIAAVAISLTQIETGLRVAGLFLAFVYTLMKIIQLVRFWNEKRNE
jgi:hypothetical protein